jgi:hypothetical protein
MKWNRLDSADIFEHFKFKCYAANSFAYVPGYDMIEWLMERLCIEDSGETSMCTLN